MKQILSSHSVAWVSVLATTMMVAVIGLGLLIRIPMEFYTTLEKFDEVYKTQERIVKNQEIIIKNNDMLLENHRLFKANHEKILKLLSKVKRD